MRHAAAHGPRPAGETGFTGHGQGRAPGDLAARIAEGLFASALVVGERDVRSPAVRLAALPDQERPRPDPVYRLIALAKDPDSPTAGAR